MKFLYLIGWLGLLVISTGNAMHVMNDQGIQVIQTAIDNDELESPPERIVRVYATPVEQPELKNEHTDAIEVVNANTDAVEVVETKSDEAEVVETKSDESAEVVETKSNESEVIETKPDEAEVVETKPDAVEVVETKPDAAEVVETKPDAAEVVEAKPEAAEVVEAKPEAAEVVEAKSDAAEVVETKSDEAEAVETNSDESEVEKSNSGAVEVDAKVPISVAVDFEPDESNLDAVEANSSNQTSADRIDMTKSHTAEKDSIETKADGIEAKPVVDDVEDTKISEVKSGQVGKEPDRKPESVAVDLTAIVTGKPTVNSEFIAKVAVESDGSDEEHSVQDEKDVMEKNLEPEKVKEDTIYNPHGRFIPYATLFSDENVLKLAYASYTQRICAYMDSGEYFRREELLKENCHLVQKCSVVRSQVYFEDFSCPKGQFFDVEKQECLDSDKVLNCHVPFKEKPHLKKVYAPPRPVVPKPKPLKDYCTPEECPFPDCYCSRNGEDIPGNLDLSDVPQMIAISYQGSTGFYELDTFKEIFSSKRKNPNGCSIKGNWFVATKYSSYYGIEELHAKGHEIASMGITQNSSNRYWLEAEKKTFYDEYVGAREILKRFAQVPKEDVVGIRIPLLHTTNPESQYKMMAENGFLYDSTMEVDILKRMPVWPYNLKFGFPHRCYHIIGITRSCPELVERHDAWQIPLNRLDNFYNWHSRALIGCSTFSNCPLENENNFLMMLTKKLNKHYLTNRAPIVFAMEAGFFTNNPGMLEKFTEWIDAVLKEYKDVYFVTNKNIIDWVQNPTPVSKLDDFEPWKGKKCAGEGSPRCRWKRVNSCRVPTHFEKRDPENIYLYTCNYPCPPYYPWIGNTDGFTKLDHDLPEFV